MSELIDRFYKINLRVRSMASARELFEDVLGAELIGDRGADTIGDFDGRMVRIGNVVLDLMAPNTPDGRLAKVIDQRGEGLDSICFTVGSLDEVAERLAARGIQLVNRREYHGNHVAFIHPRDACGVAIELIQPPAQEA